MTEMKDPVAALLERDEHREDMLRGLGLALRNLADVVGEYKSAWKAATGTGWAKADLVKAGFLDPVKLPRVSISGARGSAAPRVVPDVAAEEAK
jgi:hypothetical protein